MRSKFLFSFKIIILRIIFVIPSQYVWRILHQEVLRWISQHPEVGLKCLFLENNADLDVSTLIFTCISEKFYYLSFYLRTDAFLLWQHIKVNMNFWCIECFVQTGMLHRHDTTNDNMDPVWQALTSQQIDFFARIMVLLFIIVGLIS